MYVVVYIYATPYNKTTTDSTLGPRHPSPNSSDRDTRKYIPNKLGWGPDRLR